MSGNSASNPQPAKPRQPTTGGTKITRRAAILGAGATTVVVGGILLTRRGGGVAAGAGGRGGTLTSPSVIASDGGRLATTLVVGQGSSINGKSTRAYGYNGTSPGPTLIARPGDTLTIQLDNQLAEPTNLHTHGLHVSPAGDSDNVLRRVDPGQTATYRIAIPDDHPAGTFWYHPHHHGMVANQVFGGLYGALLIQGDEEPPVDNDRVLVISDITFSSDGGVAGASHQDNMFGREGEMVLVNGQQSPTISASSGSLERWRLINACSSRFLRLSLDDNEFGLMGIDGQALAKARPVKQVFLAPGNRADLLVELPAAGEFTLRTDDVDRAASRGMMGNMGGELSRALDLATVSVSASATASAKATQPSAWSPPPRRDISSAQVAQRRTVTFTMTNGMGLGAGFGIDGRVFDANRVDHSLKLGTVEEWTLVNTSTMDHPFHLHVWPFQVMSAPDHDPRHGPDWRDVINVPSSGSVVIRIPVEDFAGQTVFHCHIFDHEDAGMMALVEAR